ncbi:hypothetical protein V493_03838 [Pseudogymnoascus sp. VKM F-4281 (FW-2241)]|nr:hypothetical protein V493_03838 [Pseudogymnoascus sp. VKM F-4281 (FW-2241)]
MAPIDGHWCFKGRGRATVTATVICAMTFYPTSHSQTQLIWVAVGPLAGSWPSHDTPHLQGYSNPRPSPAQKLRSPLALATPYSKRLQWQPRYAVLPEKQSPAALSNAYHWAISAIPGSPEYRQHTEVQLWVMLKSDAVLQAESMNRTNSGSTGATWTGLLGAG